MLSCRIICPDELSNAIKPHAEVGTTATVVQFLWFKLQLENPFKAFVVFSSSMHWPRAAVSFELVNQFLMTQSLSRTLFTAYLRWVGHLK